MLLAVDFDEYFIDVEGIAIASVFSLQAAGINGAELDTPEADCFSGHSDPPLSQEILDITVAEIEAIVQPGGVANYVWRESVTFVCIHPPILSISVSLLVSTRSTYRHSVKKLHFTGVHVVHGAHHQNLSRVKQAAQGRAVVAEPLHGEQHIHFCDCLHEI